MPATIFRELVADYAELPLADFLRVNIKTFRRWKSGKTTPPQAVIIALSIHLSGDLGAISTTWSGFSITNG